MPRMDNITAYECDRCGRKLYAAPGDPEAATWAQPTRTNAKGDSMAIVLCTDCARAYTDLASRHDSEFTAFVNEYKKPDRGDREERA